jgi:NAD(P)H-hydrate epimerase
MRAVEQRAVEAGGSIGELMEAAGIAVAQEAWLAVGLTPGRRVLVLVGPGNNGGDGLVAARHLAEWDADVAVYLVTARPSSDENLARVRQLDIPVFVAPDDAGYQALDEAMSRAELVVDALLGTGHSRPIDASLAEILRRLQQTKSSAHPPQVISVDLPTGVDADSGNADPLAVSADMTVTLGFAKAGLYLLPGSEFAGQVQVVDIGLPKDAERDIGLELLSTAWVRERLPARPESANKGTFGRVLVVAGSDNYVGAARLAAEGCYRAGAGLVTIACTSRLQPMIAPALPEATYVLLDDTGPPEALPIIEALTQSNVLLIGPGLGQDDRTQEMLLSVLRSVPRNVTGCVLDADALNLLAKTGTVADTLPPSSILTPHPGEMARLISGSIADIQKDRLGTAITAAANWRQCVVLKGAHTVIAAPDGRAAVSPHANALLAAAGTGDVLAGAIAGLLAQGIPPFEAACCGVYLHGLAAEQISEDIGEAGMLASDLLAALPRAAQTIRTGSLTRRGPTLARFGDFSAPLAGHDPREFGLR